MFLRARFDPRWLSRLKALLGFATTESTLWHWGKAPAGPPGPLASPAPADVSPAKGSRADVDDQVALAAGVIATTGLSTLALDDLLKRLAERMAQVSGADAGAILLLDEQEGVLKPGAYYGVPDADLRGLRVPVGRGFAGRVAAERRPVAVCDVRKERSVLNPCLRRRGIRSLLGVPMLLEGRLLGVVHVDRLDVHSFSAYEVKRLQAMAEQAALAVYNAAVHERLRLANEELAAANLRLETLLHAIPAAVAIVEAASGRVVATNRAAEVLWGQQPREGSPGTAATDGRLPDPRAGHGLYRPNGDVIAWEDLPMARSIAHGETVTGEEMLLRRPDGKESFVLASSAPLRGADGRIEGAIAVFQDTSGLELEKIKDEFIAVTAHELFTPLTIIKGTAQLLERKAVADGLAGEFKAGLRTIDGRANWMTYLIQKMIDAAELQLGPLQLRKGWVELNSLARSAVRRFQATTDRHEIVLLSREERLFGYWDRERIDRVLANLIENAIKYSPGGGRIEVEVKRTNLRDPLDLHSQSAEREWALIRVSDRGLGIPKDEQAHLFRRFYRAGGDRYQDSAGLGLGLHISNRYVAAHGGHICLESEPNKGSSFYVSLPVDREVPPAVGECCSSA